MRATDTERETKEPVPTSAVEATVTAEATSWPRRPGKTSGSLSLELRPEACGGASAQPRQTQPARLRARQERSAPAACGADRGHGAAPGGCAGLPSGGGIRDSLGLAGLAGGEADTRTETRWSRPRQRRNRASPGQRLDRRFHQLSSLIRNVFGVGSRFRRGAGDKDHFRRAGRRGRETEGLLPARRFRPGPARQF